MQFPTGITSIDLSTNLADPAEPPNHDDGADYIISGWLGVNEGDISGPPIEWEPGELEGGQ